MHLGRGLASHPYEVALGHLDPPDTVSGAQGRLSNLGYACPLDGVLGPETKEALSELQATIGLPLTGVVDDYTRDALVRLAGR